MGITQRVAFRWPRWQAVALAAVLLLAMAAAVLYGLRTYRAYHALRAARTADVSTIRGWMTLHYVARAYGVAEPRLKERLGLDREAGERTTLATQAAQQGRASDDYLLEVQRAVTEIRNEQRGPPPGGGPSTG